MKDKQHEQGAKSKNSDKPGGPRSLENLLLTKIDLERALCELKLVDQLVLMFRFWEGQKMDEVAKRMSMSAEAVKKIQDRAIIKLRRSMLEDE
jgi:RNA polymerase sigma factor (sigma-70 family)